MKALRTGPLHEASRRIRQVFFAPRVVLVTVGVVVVYILFVICEIAALKALHVHTNGSALAFLLGFIIATFLCVILAIAIVFTGATSYLAGGLAERWTKKELVSLGPAWHIFSNVPFSVGFGDKAYTIDVDHIAVGPYGVLVLETKFSSSALDLGAAQLEMRVREAMVQVEDNAGRIRALLQQVDPGVPIRPVIVFWGRLVKPAGSVVRRVEGRAEDVRIVQGGEAKKWRAKLREQVVLPPEAVERVSAKIASYTLDMSRSSMSRPSP